QFTNPAILLGSYRKNFTAAYLGETAAEADGKIVHNIELTPKSKSNIVKVSLQIEKRLNLPQRIVVHLKDNTSNTIQISGVKTNANHPDSFFTFPNADYPNAEMIDLRP
ncbi:MAG: outer-membrane lipoprotein carrier protein LolA, partial [Tannerellaceae bacterium]|nr:outer-membrane lipoprotein carrier protein LolA [Tannerellaceae bacterium]